MKSPERKIQEQPHLRGLLQPRIKSRILLLCEQYASVGGIYHVNVTFYLGIIITIISSFITVIVFK